MWSLLLKLLEFIGRIRLPFIKGKTQVKVGNPATVDFLGDYGWRNYLDSRKLSQIWGPHPNSPWTPFHCLTLFVALDYIQQDMIGPCDYNPWPLQNVKPPTWIDAKTLIFVDLPGPKSVALGSVLAVSGCDIVCTFNNWPHPKGLVRPEYVLSALLRYASWLGQNRSAFPTPAPVAWLCDQERFSGYSGQPGQFDNRYYIEDSVIPGPKFLLERGITKVVYISEETNVIKADLANHLYFYHKEGIRIGHVVAFPEGTLGEPSVIIPEKRNFSTTGFFRSSAGGFGGVIPQPSSGGSGG